MSEQTIGVLLVDDHAVVRTGYRTLLESAADIEVVAEADTGRSACRLYAEFSPSVVIMDLSLPDMGGLEAIRRIIARDPKARTLVFSMHEDTVFVDQAIKAGVRGYITKRSAPDVLVDAVRRIAGGETYFDSELFKRLASQRNRGDGRPFAGLSVREFEICCLLAEGANVSEIAKRLSLSYKTVANYGTQIKNKLHVKTVAELTRLAIRCGAIRA